MSGATRIADRATLIWEPCAAKHGAGCRRSDAAQVLRKLRRLPWRAHEPYLVRTMLRATKGRYDDLPSVAALAGGLSQYHPSLGVALADALLEEVSARLVLAVRLYVSFRNIIGVACLASSCP